MASGECKLIARITGTLVDLDTESNTVLLEVEDIGYEVLVPGYAVSDLSQQRGRTITLYCLEYYEGSRLELYNLADDLGETQNLARKLPQKADELRQRLNAWRKDADAHLPTPNPDYRPQ